MTYKQLQPEDRKILESLNKQRHSCRYIAKLLQVSHTTVSREIRRNSLNNEYCWKAAQTKKDTRRILTNKKLAKLKPRHLRYIFGKLKQTLSPEQISAILPTRFGLTISTKSIYLAIYRECKRDGGDSSLFSCLRIRSRLHRKKWRLYHGPIATKPNISDRSEAANNRSEYGHWELDLFHGSRRNRLARLVLVDRKSRYTIVHRLKEATQKEVKTVLERLLRRFKVHSVTTDNGAEFLNATSLSAAVGGPVFYCNPYHSWEKGLVENTIGLYREAQDKINSRPKKVLGFATPKSLYKKLLINS